MPSSAGIASPVVELGACSATPPVSFSKPRDGFPAIGRLPAHHPVGASFDDRAKTGANDFMVVRNQYLLHSDVPVGWSHWPIAISAQLNGFGEDPANAPRRGLRDAAQNKLQRIQYSPQPCCSKSNKHFPGPPPTTGKENCHWAIFVRAPHAFRLCKGYFVEAQRAGPGKLGVGAA